MATTNLNLSTLANGQSQPEQTHNDALNHMAFLLSRPGAAIDLDGASPAIAFTSNISTGLTGLSFNGNFFFTFQDGTAPTGTAVVTIPDGLARGLFSIVNNSTIGVTVKYASTAGETVAASSRALMSGDGTDINLEGSGGGGGGGGTWLSLTDTPGSFTALQVPSANAGGTALEFISAATLKDRAEFFRGTDVTGSLTPLAGKIIRGNGINFELVDQILGPGAPFQGAMVELTADETTLGSGEVEIPWDAVIYDTSSIWAGGSPTRLTVPSDVTKVRLTLVLAITPSNLVNSTFVFIKKNGGGTYKGQDVELRFVGEIGAVVTTNVIEVTGGDFFEASVSGLHSTSDIRADRSAFSMEVLERSGQNIRTVLEPCRFVAGANVTIATLNNGDSFGGGTAATGDRVILDQQSTAAENGVYIIGAAEGGTVRAVDNDSDGDFFLGQIVPVYDGTGANRQYMLTGTATLAGSKTYTIL